MDRDEIVTKAHNGDIYKEVSEEERRKELIENLPCGAGIYKVFHGKIKAVYRNKRYLELLGRSSEKEMNEPILSYIQLEDRAYMLRVLQESILHDGRMDCEIHILHSSGRYLPFHIVGNIVKRDTHMNMIYVTFTPIEEREISFREMIPVALKVVMASSTDLSFVKDRTLTYVCASRAFANMVGYDDEAEIIGKTDYDLFEKGLAEKYRADDQNLFRDGKSIIDFVENIPSKDGTTRYASTSKFLLKDSVGNIIGLYGIGRDITENKEAFERLKLLTDSIPGGLATYELSSQEVRTLYLSDGIYKLTGYTKEEYMAVRGDNPLQFIREEDLPVIWKQIESLLNQKEPIDCTYRLIQKEGGYRWINLKGTEADRQDNCVIINAVLFDVTETITSSMRLREMERENWNRYEHELQLRKELIRDSIFYYQLNLTNNKIEEYHSQYDDTKGMKSGVNTDEKIRENILGNIAPEDHGIIRDNIFSDAIKRKYKNGETSNSVIYRRKIPGKGYRWVRTEISVMEKPESSDLIAFLHCHDIDVEQKSKLAIETIMDEDIESVMVLNVENGKANAAHIQGRVTRENYHDSFLFDQEYEAVLPFSVVEEDRDVFSNLFKLAKLIAVLKKEKIVNLTYRVIDDGIIHRKMTKAYYLDERKTEIVLVRRDITGLYEEEQRQKKVLQEAMEEANRANRAKSDFLSHMSHDIRTPLNAVLAFSNQVMIHDASREQLMEYLKKVNLSGEYLLGIINDVLDMSRIEQNKVILNPEPYYLEDFENTIRNVIDESSKKRGINFVMDVRMAGDCGILVDHVRFNQIFINLLSNAVKFTPEGGRVEFIIETVPGKNRKVPVRRFIVRDNGIGMSKEFLPHAYDSFQQEYRKGLSERSQGTGLGLSIVKELVNLMDGTIQLESALNQGTTFIVDLPLVEIAKVDMKREEKIINYEHLRGIHFLLVEDNDINMEIAVTLLGKMGCIVESVENGKIACEKFADSEPEYYQLILMDIRMPVMDGLTAARTIRSMERGDAQKIPIIAMTADAFNEDEQTAKEAGMNAHISKPVEPRSLFDVCNYYASREYQKDE